MGIFTSQNQDEIKPADAKQAKTFIGPLTVVEANIIGKEDIVIDGTFSGILKIDGDLFILESAQVSGEFEAVNILIQGAVQGKILVTGKVELSETARVTADIKTKFISVQSGAILNGHCQTKNTDDNKLPNQKLS